MQGCLGAQGQGCSWASAGTWKPWTWGMWPPCVCSSSCVHFIIIALLRPAFPEPGAHVADRTLSTHSSQIQMPVQLPEKCSPIPAVPVCARCFLLAESFWRLSHNLGDSSQNATVTTLMQSSGVEGLRVVIPSWATLHKGADYRNTDLVEDFTNVHISWLCRFFIHFMKYTFGILLLL